MRYDDNKIVNFPGIEGMGDMGIGNMGIDVSALIDDRVEDGVFRVDRSVYLDERLYEAEIERIFEKGWVFLCHESQLPHPDSFFTTYIGRQPVFVNRRKEGGYRAFINACSHRAALLTPCREGRARVLTCRFHGWAYASDGRCIKIKNEDTGFPDEGFDREQFNLRNVAQVDEYRGFVFGCLDEDAGTLADHLGESRPFIDLFVDQSPDGLEVLRGSQTYVCDHNWKLQAENVPDGYHVSTVHRNFMTTVLAREDRDGLSGLSKTETGRMKDNVKNGSYDLGYGHMLIWADRSSPEAAPLFPATEQIEKAFPAAKAHWMLRRGRNLFVFPNLVLNDLAATHMRCHRPLSANKVEVTIWCIAPRGEPAQARTARLRKFEDFFLVTGMATSDDVISLDVAQAGSYGRAARWNEFARGLSTIQPGADEEARALGVNPVHSNSSWDFESAYIGFYRTWRDILNGAA